MGRGQHARAVRAAVYQRHLSTMGGGERYALDVARWLRDRGADVDVMAPGGVSLERVGDRLGVDVDGLGLVPLDPAGSCPDAASRSHEYDVFVNATFGSEATNRARCGVYVVHFPTQPLTHRLAGAVTRAGAGRPAYANALAMSGGVQDPARGWWTTGHGWIDVITGGRAAWTLRLVLAARHGAWGGGTRTAEIRVDGQTVRRVRVPARGVRPVALRLPVGRPFARYTIELRSDTRHDDMAGVPLGVHVRSARLTAPGSRPVGIDVQPFLSTYDSLIACSGYTAEWVRRWWSADAEVVHPAVPPPSADGVERERSIVVAGRFFSGNHSKRQLELVGAFRRMCERGLSGWTLHLIGGVTGLRGEHYLRRVRAAAEGLPVRIDRDADREHFARALARASIAWQAPGWGDDPERNPERFEHFGITAVEVMAAGAVPVALAVGGVNEVVRHGVDGMLWTTGPEEHTLALIEDPARLERMSRAAQERARSFSPDAFDERIGQVLAPLLPPANGREASVSVLRPQGAAHAHEARHGLRWT